MHEVDAEELLRYQITPREVDENGNGPSPLRLSNFDLLKTATTHSALLRLQKELESEPTQKHVAEWLTLFTKAHGACFTYSGRPYQAAAGRAFILTMMAQPVSMGMSLGGNARFL